MPSVTYDGRSFMLDGRRVWLVGGSIHYARVPRDLWPERIHAAKLAGLNTIETPVFWNRHEARPGQFDFTGDNDIRHFVQLVGQAGMYCVLRPGPFVGSDWDNGGLPAWLSSLKDVALRRASGPYLEACSRYLTALAEQVRDLQVTSPRGGAIILVQNETSWTCGDDKLATGYLGEINRYLREAGLTVPFINANNLWQGTEGEIDCWSGSGDLMPTLRQLAAVRPNQPRLVADLAIGASSTWGSEAPASPDPAATQHRLAQVLAAGSQFIISPFHGGTNFGFWGGRVSADPGSFVTAGRESNAPLTETGGHAPCYNAVRRLCTFASRFARVFANLDPTLRPVVNNPASEGSPGLSVAYSTGVQGGVAFVFGPSEAGDRSGRAGRGARRPMTLLLPDGTTLGLELGPDQPVAWCLFNVSLGGRATLDYCNLNAFGTVGRVLVCYGPAGAPGQVSINGSPVQTTVPSGKEPVLLDHEGIMVVVCNEDQIDATFIADDAVYVGVSGLDAAGAPIALPGSRQCMRVASDGAVSTVPASTVVKKAPAKIALSEWSPAPANEYAAGTSARYAAIDGPADLTALGSPYGLGWYRVRLKFTGPKMRVAFPKAADRLHVMLDGDPQGIVGVGPGSVSDLTLAAPRGLHTVVVLAENLGRVCGGANLGEPKGLFGHFWEVKPLRIARPAVKIAEPVNILAFRSPLWEVHEGDLSVPERLTWALPRRGKMPLIMSIDSFPGRGLVLLNNTPVRFLERLSRERIVFEPEQFSRGKNTVQIVLLNEPVAGRAPESTEVQRELADAVAFFQAVSCPSAKAEWAFAKWEVPAASHFLKGSKAPPPRKGHCPIWWRASFEAEDTEAPLFFEATGLTKGQIYINNKHLGRYFVATATGKRVPPQTRWYIPRSWLKPGASNSITIFDEHGADPGRARLVYETPGV